MLRWYEPLVVPCLLQTGDYARAILSARPDGNLDDLDEQVAARLARQAISDRTGAPQLWCILDEGVLHRALGGSKIMRSQLYRLAEVAEHPRTTIQVIRSGGTHAGLLAHFVTAALTAGGRAVAVIGTGIDRVYPPQNAGLQEEIAARVLVISQFLPGSPPTRASFPMRNAVMSGYALATVVVEAADRSGSRVQARLALQHGRHVFLMRSLLERRGRPR